MRGSMYGRTTTGTDDMSTPLPFSSASVRVASSSVLERRGGGGDRWQDRGCAMGCFRSMEHDRARQRQMHSMAWTVSIRIQFFVLFCEKIKIAHPGQIFDFFTVDLQYTQNKYISLFFLNFCSYLLWPPRNTNWLSRFLRAIDQIDYLFLICTVFSGSHLCRIGDVQPARCKVGYMFPG